MKPLKRFVPLDKSLHDRPAFDCGKTALNQFLAKQAAKHMQLGISATYVLPTSGKTENSLKAIASFYTLSMGEISRNSLPNTKKFPHYPVPVIVLARLAVDKQIQGRGYGDITLIKAIRHSAKVSKALPAYAIVLDIKDKQARRFYERFPDFKPLMDQSTRLFLPIKIAQKI
ncbi:MAG: GNAT family N-acetyltransferase [Thiohalomonadales bacterium]